MDVQPRSHLALQEVLFEYCYWSFPNICCKVPQGHLSALLQILSQDFLLLVA